MSAEQRRITLTENDDRWWTAHDDECGLTAQGETRDGALESLDAVIEAVEGNGGRPPTDEELRAAGIDPEASHRHANGELPDVLE